MDIKEKIAELTVEQRRQLAYAFDHEFAQFIEFKNNEFIGVHLDFKRFPNFQIIKIIGVWSCGTIKK